MRNLFPALLLAAVALAQAPRGDYAWWDTPLVRDLNLSDDQSSQIRAAVREHRGKLIDLRAAVERAELEIEDMMNSDAVDLRRAGEVADRLVKARGDLTREFTLLSFRIRAVLSPGQWRDLQKRLEGRPPGPRRPPGGPGLEGSAQPPPRPRPPVPKPRPNPPDDDAL